MNRIYKNGKAIEVKIVKERTTPTRGQMAQFFGKKFEENIKKQVDVVQSRWLPRYDQQNLLHESTSFIYSLNSIIETVDKVKAKIRKLERTKINATEDRLKQFQHYIESLNLIDLNDTTGFIEGLLEVINETRHFIFQFNLVCDCLTNDQQLPFREADWAKKRSFLKAVVAYQENHSSSKFPPFKLIKLALVDISEKTYGLWKKQLEAGTLHYFVQPKNNRH